MKWSRIVDYIDKHNKRMIEIHTIKSFSGTTLIDGITHLGKLEYIKPEFKVNYTPPDSKTTQSIVDIMSIGSFEFEDTYDLYYGKGSDCDDCDCPCKDPDHKHDDLTDEEREMNRLMNTPRVYNTDNMTTDSIIRPTILNDETLIYPIFYRSISSNYEQNCRVKTELDKLDDTDKESLKKVNKGDITEEEFNDYYFSFLRNPDNEKAEKIKSYIEIDKQHNSLNIELALPNLVDYQVYVIAGSPNNLGQTASIFLNSVEYSFTVDPLKKNKWQLKPIQNKYSNQINKAQTNLVTFDSLTEKVSFTLNQNDTDNMAINALILKPVHVNKDNDPRILSEGFHLSSKDALPNEENNSFKDLFVFPVEKGQLVGNKKGINDGFDILQDENSRIKFTGHYKLNNSHLIYNIDTRQFDTETFKLKDWNLGFSLTGSVTENLKKGSFIMDLKIDNKVFRLKSFYKNKNAYKKEKECIYFYPCYKGNINSVDTNIMYMSFKKELENHPIITIDIYNEEENNFDSLLINNLIIEISNKKLGEQRIIERSNNNNEWCLPYYYDKYEENETQPIFYEFDDNVLHDEDKTVRTSLEPIRVNNNLMNEYSDNYLYFTRYKLYTLKISITNVNYNIEDDDSLNQLMYDLILWDDNAFTIKKDSKTNIKSDLYPRLIFMTNKDVIELAKNSYASYLDIKPCIYKNHDLKVTEIADKTLYENKVRYVNYREIETIDEMNWYIKANYDKDDDKELIRHSYSLNSLEWYNLLIKYKKLGGDSHV